MRFFKWIAKVWDAYITQKAKEDIERRNKEIAARVVARTPYGR